MKYLTYTAIISLIAFFTISCKTPKENCASPTTKAPDTEITALDQYITSNSIVASKDDRGFYYIIDNAGDGPKPTVCSTVQVKYIGKLTNGVTFDQSNGATFQLSNLIVGWQQGIPLIAKGGKITLILPPSLGYGNNAVGNIPANSILIFIIELI